MTGAIALTSVALGDPDWVTRREFTRLAWQMALDQFEVVLGDICPPNVSGVYRITIGERFYVGSSVNLRSRESSHRTTLANGTHSNLRMQRAWNKVRTFTFEILELCDPAGVLLVEQSYLDAVADDPLCMNLSPTARNNYGIRWSAVTRARMSASARLRGPRPPELVERIAAQLRGAKRSDEFRRAVSEAHRGRVKSPTERESISKASLSRVALECVAWSQAHDGRFPSARAVGQSELRLGQWLRRQRHSRTSAARQEWLDENYAGWRSSHEHSARWLGKLQEAIDWFDTHKLPPMIESIDRIEDSLARWLRGVSRRADEREVCMLNECVPNWRQKHPGSRSLNWETNAQRYAVWVDQHGGCRPRQGCDDADEAFLGGWFKTQAENATAERDRWFDREIPGWRTAKSWRPDTWTLTAKSCIAWSAGHDGLHPRQKSGDSTERRLGVWLCNARFARGAQQVPDARFVWLDHEYVGWRHSNRSRARRTVWSDER